MHKIAMVVHPLPPLIEVVIERIGIIAIKPLPAQFQNAYLLNQMTMLYRLLARESGSLKLTWFNMPIQVE